VELKRKMDTAFGSVDACMRAFAAAATSQFGSGWAWLVLDRENLKIVKTGEGAK